jgi:hypothetical protein
VRSAQYVVGDGTCMMRREGKGKERGEEKRREEKISQGEREKKEETSFVYMPQVFLSSFTSFSTLFIIIHRLTHQDKWSFSTLMLTYLILPCIDYTKGYTKEKKGLGDIR